MFYRRKILLALVQLLDNELGKTRLHKLLFLFTQERAKLAQQQVKSEYDFIPYKYGCYSYSLEADLVAMVRTGLLQKTQDKPFTLNDKTDYLNQLKTNDIDGLRAIKDSFGDMDRDALIKYTYIHYPYWAINSDIAEGMLTAQAMEAVNQSKPKSDKTVLCTIGYEGISLEEYLNRLIKNDIKVLVDVRGNPLSMKYGFSKKQLQNYCESLKIEYHHFPEVGIQSKQRQGLNTQIDYDYLFACYVANNLTNTKKTQEYIFDLLKKHQRIALTCFEADINRCHRKYLAEAIAGLPEFNYELKHI